MKAIYVVLISVAATCAAWILLIFIGYLYFFSSPRPFQVKVDAPSTVSLDDVFDISVEATNRSSKQTVLGSIDIYSSLLDGFELISIIPNPSSDSRMFGFRTLTFSQSIEPNDKHTIVFTLKAFKEGYFAGDIDVCTPTQKFSTVNTGIKVNTAEQGAAANP